MSWTYTNAPDTTTAAGMRDAVRFLIGDVDTTDQQLADEAIAFLLDQNGSDVYRAASEACAALAAKYSREVDVSMGGTSISASQRAKAYKELESSLRGKSFVTLEVFAGGLTVAGKEALDSDTGAVQGAFRMDQDSPASLSSDSWTRT